MAKTVAQSQQDVNKMSKRDRLWDSLDYSYGQKREDVQKQYDRALSQTDNQFLSRGMQRSSYAGQTMANLRQEGADAVADVYSQQIADYENRLGEIEQQEQAQANWERTFAQNQQQINWNQQYQQGQLDYQQKSADQQYAYNTLLQIAQNGGNATSDLLKRAGISRADFNNMKAKQKKTGGGGRSSNSQNDSANPINPGNVPTDDGLNNALYFSSNDLSSNAPFKQSNNKGFVPYKNTKLAAVQQAAKDAKKSRTSGPIVSQKEMEAEYNRRLAQRSSK